MNVYFKIYPCIDIKKSQTPPKKTVKLNMKRLQQKFASNAEKRITLEKIWSIDVVSRQIEEMRTKKHTVYCPFDSKTSVEQKYQDIERENCS